MNVFKYGLLSIVMLLAHITAVNAQTMSDDKYEVTELEALDFTWSGHRAHAALLTKGRDQFVGYYDANRQMTIAHRKIGSPWVYYKVDSWLGWDSHNYVTLQLDSEGYLHVLGNMHADPLEYFRMIVPMSVRSIRRVDVMADASLEKRMTYPAFLKNKNNQLIAKYRDGGSGDGSEIYNIYDTKTKSWSRLHKQQFLDGEGKMNAYFEGPTMGPDGRFHLAWVWRDTPNAATNHDLSYARSSDLINWEDSNGNTLELPITLSKTEVVDPVPAFGGMINGNTKLGFDQNKAPIIAYHKYDKEGNTQIYVARKLGKNWQIKQISQWDNYRWDFGGGGSLGRFPVKPQAPVVLSTNEIGVTVRRDNDVMQFVLDKQSLDTIRVEPAEVYPSILDTNTLVLNDHLKSSDKISLQINIVNDSGESEDGQYYLTWKSQPGNRDQARTTIPEPSLLLLHKVKQK